MDPPVHLKGEERQRRIARRVLVECCTVLQCRLWCQCGGHLGVRRERTKEVVREGLS